MNKFKKRLLILSISSLSVGCICAGTYFSSSTVNNYVSNRNTNFVLTSNKTNTVNNSTVPSAPSNQPTTPSTPTPPSGNEPSTPTTPPGNSSSGNGSNTPSNPAPTPPTGNEPNNPVPTPPGNSSSGNGSNTPSNPTPTPPAGNEPNNPAPTPPTPPTENITTSLKLKNIDASKLNEFNLIFKGDKGFAIDWYLSSTSNSATPSSFITAKQNELLNYLNSNINVVFDHPQQDTKVSNVSIVASSNFNQDMTYIASVTFSGLNNNIPSSSLSSEINIILKTNPSTIASDNIFGFINSQLNNKFLHSTITPTANDVIAVINEALKLPESQNLIPNAYLPINTEPLDPNKVIISSSTNEILISPMTIIFNSSNPKLSTKPLSLSIPLVIKYNQPYFDNEMMKKTSDLAIILASVIPGILVLSIIIIGLVTLIRKLYAKTKF